MNARLSLPLESDGYTMENGTRRYTIFHVRDSGSGTGAGEDR